MRNDWLAQRLKEVGKTGQGLATALGINKSRISEIIGGRRGVKADEIITISTYLKMNERDVVSLLSGRPVASAAALSEAPPVGGKSPRREDLSSGDGAEAEAGGAVPDIPVMGTIAGGADADFDIHSDVVDRVRRPAGLANARNVFALYVVGSSMSPRYQEGDLIFVHPGRPAVSGCDVVVELRGQNESGRKRVLLKSYRGKSPTHLFLTQYNPRSELEIPLDRVKQVLRVLRTNELLGI